MSFFRQLSLRTQMLTVVACIILAGFALTLSILTWQAGQMQRDAALQYAGELAAHNGRAAAVPLQQGLEAARTLAATMVAQDAARQAMSKGMHEVEVRVQGAGAGRESAVRAIQSAGIHVTLIKDCTPIPHNGCRPRKRRRV